jgi:hypothetical protein
MDIPRCKMGFEIPPWLRWYKKPDYVDIKKFAGSFQDKRDGSPSRPRPSSPIATGSIPKKLALDRILKNKTCT